MHKIIHRKRKKEKHSSLGRWCHWILKCFSVSQKEENWHKKYVVLCYPVLYISWNPRCRVQEKSSLREKVSLQHLRSGKTISWNGRKEMRSKLFPLFSLFSPSFEKKMGWEGCLTPLWVSSCWEGSHDKRIQDKLVYCDRMGQLNAWYIGSCFAVLDVTKNA